MDAYVVCPSVPFPNIYWWGQVLRFGSAAIDIREHYEKMSLRNKYIICTASGALTLSIPLCAGRQQRRPMDEVQIDNKSDWQQQHWRTLLAAYNRSPYFEFYKDSLYPLFHHPYTSLAGFNRATCDFLIKALRFSDLQFFWPEEYRRVYNPPVHDIRHDFRTNAYRDIVVPEKKYHQVFEDRNGFLPNLSILDLLFCEGKNMWQFL